MGVIRWRGKLLVYGRGGFILSETKKRIIPIRKQRPKISHPIRKTKRASIIVPRVKIKVNLPVSGSLNLLSSAQDFFRKTHKLSREDKVDDLMETSPQTRKVSNKNILWWKENIKKRDLEGVDTRNELQAMSLMPQPDFAGDLLGSYKASDGDIFSFKTKDKRLKDSIFDEAMSELRF